MERFQGARSPPEIPINSPVAMKKRKKRRKRKKGERIIGRRHTHKREIINKERELDSSSQLAAYKLLFAYLLFQSFWWTGLSYSLYRPKRRSPNGPEQSSGQRRTRFTLHRHPKNPALNKGGIQDSIFPLPCNRKVKPAVIFHLIQGNVTPATLPHFPCQTMITFGRQWML